MTQTHHQISHEVVDNCTPLSTAASNSSLAIAEPLLLSDEANKDAPGSKGMTPLSWVSKNGYERMKKFLSEYDARETQDARVQKSSRRSRSILACIQI
jgi:ankyrin repeat protein